MTPAEAFEALGLVQGEASPSLIKAAFKAKAFSSHPDTGGTAAAFDGLKEARDVAIIAAQDDKCRQCQGAGYMEVPSGFSSYRRVCPCGDGLRWKAD